MANTYFTEDHEWLRVEGGVATVGITDYAQEQLGDLVFVELPEIGRKLAKGDTAVVVESVKAASDVYAPVDGEITADIALAGLEMFEVDDQGLDRLDHAILIAIVQKFSGGPVGLTTLAAAVGEEPDTVEDVVEPYLLQLGFLQRTPRGRVATERAYRHLDAAAPGRLPI